MQKMKNHLWREVSTMNTNVRYRCIQCGNSHSFTRLVQELRQYPVNSSGDCIAASEPVDDTERFIAMTCDTCNAVVASPVILSEMVPQPCPFIDGCNGKMHLLPGLTMNCKPEDACKTPIVIMITKTVIRTCDTCDRFEVDHFEQEYFTMSDFIHAAPLEELFAPHDPDRCVFDDTHAAVVE